MVHNNFGFCNNKILLEAKVFFHEINFCIPITFNNPLKAYLSNKKCILQSKHTRHKLYISLKEN